MANTCVKASRYKSLARIHSNAQGSPYRTHARKAARRTRHGRTLAGCAAVACSLLVLARARIGGAGVYAFKFVRLEAQQRGRSAQPLQPRHASVHARTACRIACCGRCRRCLHAAAAGTRPHPRLAPCWHAQQCHASVANQHWQSELQTEPPTMTLSMHAHVLTRAMAMKGYVYSRIEHLEPTMSCAPSQRAVCHMHYVGREPPTPTAKSNHVKQSHLAHAGDVLTHQPPMLEMLGGEGLCSGANGLNGGGGGACTHGNGARGTGHAWNKPDAESSGARACT